MGKNITGYPFKGMVCAICGTFSIYGMLSNHIEVFDFITFGLFYNSLSSRKIRVM